MRGAFDRRSCAVSSGLRSVGMKARGALMAVLLLSFPAAAAEPRLTCFGNEPSWGLQFTGPGAARLLFPDAPPVAYLGSETRLDFLGERA